MQSKRKSPTPLPPAQPVMPEPAKTKSVFVVENYEDESKILRARTPEEAAEEVAELLENDDSFMNDLEDVVVYEYVCVEIKHHAVEKRKPELVFLKQEAV